MTVQRALGAEWEPGTLATAPGGRVVVVVGTATLGPRAVAAVHVPGWIPGSPAVAAALARAGYRVE